VKAPALNIPVLITPAVVREAAFNEMFDHMRTMCRLHAAQKLSAETRKAGVHMLAYLETHKEEMKREVMS